MSQETSQWLNTMTLIGFTDKRGDAWHYREADQGDESNHYPGAIPEEDVLRRLFGWEFVSGPVKTGYVTAEGEPVSLTDDTRQAIIRPAGSLGDDDPGAIVGVFKSGYQIHGYHEWLMENLKAISGKGLQIGSAGLLRGGAQAWVQVELEKTQHVDGIEFRPFLHACTSADGTLASTYGTGDQLVVCDNTLKVANSAIDGKRVKVKHSKNSLGRITDVQEALGILAAHTKQTREELSRLVALEVTEDAWQAFLDNHPMTSLVKPDGTEKVGRGFTVADNRRDAWSALWANDPRCAPWNGTAFGVLQTVNTWEHHHSSVHGGEEKRAAKNMGRMVKGEWEDISTETLEVLDKALATVA